MKAGFFFHALLVTKIVTVYICDAMDSDATISTDIARKAKLFLMFWALAPANRRYFAEEVGSFSMLSESPSFGDGNKPKERYIVGA